MKTYRLPFPPSVNHYYRSTSHGVLISKAGRQYRKDVAKLPRPLKPLEGRLAMLVEIYPPDRARRDVDNLGKAILDACQHAGWYHDDGQIDDLRFVRRDVGLFAPGMKGLVVVTMWSIEEGVTA